MFGQPGALVPSSPGNPLGRKFCCPTAGREGGLEAHDGAPSQRPAPIPTGQESSATWSIQVVITPGWRAGAARRVFAKSGEKQMTRLVPGRLPASAGIQPPSAAGVSCIRGGRSRW